MRSDDATFCLTTISRTGIIPLESSLRTKRVRLPSLIMSRLLVVSWECIRRSGFSFRVSSHRYRSKKLCNFRGAGECAWKMALNLLFRSETCNHEPCEKKKKKWKDLRTGASGLHVVCGLLMKGKILGQPWRRIKGK